MIFFVINMIVTWLCRRDSIILLKSIAMLNGQFSLNINVTTYNFLILSPEDMKLSVNFWLI